jgi:hypothetical protein
MSRYDLTQRIRQLPCAQQVKKRLHRLATLCPKAAEKLVEFLRRNHLFAESLVLGLLAALLLSNVPVAGRMLAILAVAASAGVGLLRQLQRSIRGES